VVAPQDWDERNKKVKTDNVDAAAMLSRLTGTWLATARRWQTRRAQSSRGAGAIGGRGAASRRVRQRQQVSPTATAGQPGKSFLLYHGVASPGGGGSGPVGADVPAGARAAARRGRGDPDGAAGYRKSR